MEHLLLRLMLTSSNLGANNYCQLILTRNLYLSMIFLLGGALIVQVQFMEVLSPTANSCGLNSELFAMFVSLISPPQSVG